MNISLIVYLKERKRLKRRLIFIKEKEKLHYDGEMGWEMVMGKLVSPPTGLISAKMTIRGG